MNAHERTCGHPEKGPPPDATKIVSALRDRSPKAGNREIAAELRRVGYPGLVSEVLASRPGNFAAAESTPGAAEPGVSSRVAHSFDNASKTMTRERNLLALVEQAGELWEDEGHTRLRCDWAELLGETGGRTLAMLERAGVLAPGGFVGIDREPGIIERFAAAHPGFKWVAADVMDALGHPALRRVGVLNFDGYEAVGSPRTRPIGHLIAEVARRSLRRFAAFTLFWNTDLDAVRIQGKATFAAALAGHARTVAEVLSGALPPRRRLTGDALLPPGSETVVDDPGFTGIVGSFEIYRGKSSGHRMSNLRLVLR